MEPEDTTTQTQRPPWLQKIMDEIGGAGGYVMSPEDIEALATWMTLQDMENQYGQIGLQERQMDLTGRQLDQQMAEQAFMQEQYFPWYTGDYFNFQKQQAADQVQMSADDRRRSANSLAQSRYQTQQAADAARTQRLGYWTELGFIEPSAAQREQTRQRKLAAINKGRDESTPRRPMGGY